MISKRVKVGQIISVWDRHGTFGAHARRLCWASDRRLGFSYDSDDESSRQWILLDNALILEVILHVPIQSMQSLYRETLMMRIAINGKIVWCPLWDDDEIVIHCENDKS